MDYKDLQSISELSNQILTESVIDENDEMNRFPYTSPYLQEERQRYKPDPKSTGYGTPEQMNRKPEDRRIPDKDTAEWLRKDAKTKKYGRPMRKYQPGVIKRGDIERQGIRTVQQVVRRNPDEFKVVPILQQDSYDYYDLVLSHLMEGGYAESINSAHSIMANMSEAWFVSIVDSYIEE